MNLQDGLLCLILFGAWLTGVGLLNKFERYGLALMEARRKESERLAFEQWEQNRITRMKQKLLGQHVSTCAEDDAAQKESYEQQTPTSPPYEHVKNCRWCFKKYYLEGAPLAHTLEIDQPVVINFSED